MVSWSPLLVVLGFLRSFCLICWSSLLFVLAPVSARVSVSVVPMVALVGCTVVPSAGSAGLLCCLYWPQSLLV